MRSGWLGITYGKLRDTGIYGDDWSSWTFPSTANYAYDLEFYVSDVNSSDYNIRYDGFPLRCLAS